MEALARHKEGRRMSSKNQTATAPEGPVTLAEILAQLPTTSTLSLSKKDVRQIAAEVGAMTKPMVNADKAD